MRLFEYRVSDVLSAVDELEPSQYGTQTKTEWLSELDGQIYEELVLTHVMPHRYKGCMLHVWDGDPLDQGVLGGQYPAFSDAEEPEDRNAQEQEEPGAGGRDRRENHRRWKWPYKSVDDILIAGNPYGKEMYVAWLQSKIAYSNAEQAKYAIYSTNYNDAYSKFAAWYNRTFLPRGPAGGNRFRF